jgi:hypothetical protein
MSVEGVQQENDCFSWTLALSHGFLTRGFSALRDYNKTAYSDGQQ